LLLQLIGACLEQDPRRGNIRGPSPVAPTAGGCGHKCPRAPSIAFAEYRAPQGADRNHVVPRAERRPPCPSANVAAPSSISSAGPPLSLHTGVRSRET